MAPPAEGICQTAEKNLKQVENYDGELRRIFLKSGEKPKIDGESQRGETRYRA